MKNNHRIFELDALRGIAALLVVIFHYHMGVGYNSIFFKIGITGVDLFFIISGFVIFQSAKASTSSGAFLINRVSRLFPNYWFAVFLTFALFCIQTYWVENQGGTPDYHRLFWNLTMFQSYVGVYDLDDPYWTLIIELVFYIFVAVFLLFKKLNWIVFGCFLVSAVSIYFSVYRWGIHSTDLLFQYFPFAKFAPLFTVGITFYYLKEKKWPIWLGTVIIIIFYLTQIVIIKHTGKSIGWITMAQYKAIIGVYILTFYLLIYGKLKWLVNPVTLFLGKISFSLYLIHQYISIHFIIPDLMKIGLPFWLSAYFIAFPTCIFLAWGMTALFDERLQPRLKTFLLKLIPSGNKQ